MSAVIEATDATFEQEVLKVDLPVLVDFWGPGCPPCARLAPILEKIATDMAGKVKFVKVNVAQEIATAAKYRIQMVPTLFVFRAGAIAESMVGLQPEADLRRKLATLADG